MAGSAGVREAVRASLITGQGAVEEREFEQAPPGPGYVTVEVSLCGICGTEINSFRTGSLHSPAVCGHEWTGVVSAAGAGVAGGLEGERVVVAVPGPCGSCPECAGGLADHCRAVQAAARGRDPRAALHGAFARSLTVDAGRVLSAHPALPDADVAQVEPATIAFHGVRRTPPRPGDTVLVQGAGPIGLLTLQLARIAGAGTVVVVEPSEQRRELARTLGADLALAPGAEAEELLLERSRGIGPDVVYECSGVPQLLQEAVRIVRHSGTVSLLSYIGVPTTIDPARWLGREVTVTASNAFTRNDVVRTMGFLADGRLRVRPLHTRTIGLAELAPVLAELAAGRSSDVKVLVDPRRG